MTENERVRELRKTLGLTLDQFGSAVCVSNAAISHIESGKNAVSDRMRMMICREFRVSEAWLRTGEGEMFEFAQVDELDQIFARYPDVSLELRTLIRRMLDLPAPQQAAVARFIADTAEALHAQRSPGADPPEERDPVRTREDFLRMAGEHYDAVEASPGGPSEASLSGGSSAG